MGNLFLLIMSVSLISGLFLLGFFIALFGIYIIKGKEDAMQFWKDEF